MSTSISAKVLFGIGVASMCLAFSMEGYAYQNRYCQQTGYAHCGYHPCTCEDGQTKYGCSEAMDHGPTGWCLTGGSSGCLEPILPCGNKVIHDPEGCSGCYDPTELEEVCNKMHDCENYD